MPAFRDLTDQKFGRLTAIKVSVKSSKIERRHTQWLCKCECGKEVSVV